MKLRYILIAGLLLCGYSGNAARTVSYAREGQQVTFKLAWTASNYGTITWQSSDDGGQNWNTIYDAASPELKVTASATSPSLYRAVVVGDPSCPALTEEREIKLVDLSGTHTETGRDYAVIEVNATGIDSSDLAEYGFACATGGINRPYTLVPRTKVGDTFESDKITMKCEGLEAGTAYDIRPYFKTNDGSIVFGDAHSVTTGDGIRFEREGWVIEKNSVTIPFTVTGSIQGAPELWFGPNRDSLKKYNINRAGGKGYRSVAITDLEPATTYIAVLRATVDGEQVEVEKTVRTWTDYSTYEVDKSVKPVTHNVVWDTKNMICLTPEDMQVEYPRMCRVNENTILLAYHGGETDHWHNCYLRKSYDNGKTWTDPVEVYNKSNNFLGCGYWRIVNPEMTRLSNGWIIFTAVANANPETNDNCKVLASISKDGGETWGNPIVVGRGRTWEPQVVQLPGGELELLVSSEEAWWEKPGYVEQEIFCTRSTDNGETWTEYKRASYKPGARDGMPVGVVMQGNKGVLFIEESVNGNIAPSIQHRDLDGEWDDAPWDSRVDNDRWLTQLPVGAGAPYMIQLPTGEFLMMAHTNQTGNVWQTSRPQTVMADSNGRNFKNFRNPLSGNVLPSQCGAYYNSFFLYDNETVWLLYTKAQYDGDRRVESDVMILEGKIMDM